MLCVFWFHVHLYNDGGSSVRLRFTLYLLKCALGVFYFILFPNLRFFLLIYSSFFLAGDFFFNDAITTVGFETCIAK